MTKQDNELLQELREIKALIEQGINADRPMNVEEASKFLGFSTSTVYDLCSQRKITHHKPNGKRLFFKRQDLLDFMLRNKVSSDSQVDDMALKYLNRSN